MSADALKKMQEAIYLKLTGDQTFMDMIGTIGEDIQQGGEYPLVIFDKSQ
jgi:hypothetical protein